MVAGADEAVSKMREAVASGTLRLEPGTASACAAECDLMAETILRELRGLQSATAISAFGGFDSGHQLQQGFERKVKLAISHLEQYSAIATRMADNFRSIEASFAAQDDANSANIGAVANKIPGTGEA